MSFTGFARAAARAALRLVSVASFHIVRRIAERREVFGVTIISALTRGGESPHIRKAADAVQLIAKYDWGLILRIRRYMRLIMVGKKGPFFDAEKRLCVLSDLHLETLSVERIALQIAHEATHARLFSAGFRYDEEGRPRIEAVCVRAEVRLARRIPEGEELAQCSIQQLGRPWWTDRQLAERQQAMWKEAGAPNWLLRIRKRFVNWTRNPD